MKSVITIVFFLGFCSPVLGEVEEVRLLQEWGMRWSSDGKLELTAPVQASQHQEWAPEVSATSEPGKQPLPAIQPIVIRPN